MDERLYRLAVEQTRDYAVFLLDPTGHIISWNPGAQRIKGYRPEEIIGRHFSIFYPPASVQSGWPEHELTMASGEGRFEDEGWRVRKDGTRFWAAVSITALRDEDGKLLGFSKITRDLTDRKLNEEALRQSEERFRLLVDGVVDYAIYMLDPDGVITSWNTGAERIKGYSREEVIGRHFSRFYTEEDRRAGKPWEEIANARKHGRAESEGWRIRKGGQRFWARTVLTPLYDAEGQPRGFAKVTQDLSERRHIEDLEKAANNVNEFIAVLAHELRNPLAPIRAAVEVLAHAAPGDPAHKLMHRTIDRQSAQLSRIVNDMIDVSRITRGVLAIERSNIDLGEAISRAVEAAMPAIENGNHRIEVDSPAGLVVYGDLDRIAQILTNLLTNAARYSDSGSTIEVTATREGDNAVVRVRDNGHGIQPEAIEPLFHMFVQGPAALGRVRGGLGIGLALSRRLAEMHGGTLEGHSDGLDKGSEFTLRLPVGEGNARVATEPVRSEAATTPRRVLIADDNMDAAKTLDLLLRYLGHQTRVVHDGPNALKVAEEFHPEVVLLDIGMPGIDGYEVARRLRANGNWPMRIIAVTGWGQESDRKRSREAGFDMHLVKPIDANELLNAMSSEVRTLH
jgi:PAS domain S-box-containing protein